MRIPSPYLLYLGGATDHLSMKTSRGLAFWRPESCVGELFIERSTATLGLPQMNFAEAKALGAKTFVIGVANAGGVMSEPMIQDALGAIRSGLHVASGLHARLRSSEILVDAAREAGVSLFDVREPPEFLRVGTGAPRGGRRLLTVGTDCSVGKMYTTLALERELRARGEEADFRATGQTGILIAGSGVPVDAVIADFISGSVEELCPPRASGWDVIEGQGSLFHPSYAGVSLGLLHGAQPDKLVLCHEPGRVHMRGLPDYALPDLKLCLEANLTAARLTSPDVTVVGLAFNTQNLNAADAERACRSAEDLLGLPCEDPVATGVSRIVDNMLG